MARRRSRGFAICSSDYRAEKYRDQGPVLGLQSPLRIDGVAFGLFRVLKKIQGFFLALLVRMTRLGIVRRFCGGQGLVLLHISGRAPGSPAGCEMGKGGSPSRELSLWLEDGRDGFAICSSDYRAEKIQGFFLALLVRMTRLGIVRRNPGAPQ
jgi:hypothetical protein